MTQSKPVPLIGRLATQLRMLTSAEVERAMEESAASGNPKLGMVFLELGLLDRKQLEKLHAVQRDLVEKHRKRKASRSKAALPSAGASRSKAASPSAGVSRSEPALPSVGASRSEPALPRTGVTASAEIHAAAEQAVVSASSLTARDVDALHEAPAPEALRPPQGAEPLPESLVSDSAVIFDGSPPSELAAASEERASVSPPRADSAPMTALSEMPGEGSLELSIPDCGPADRERLEAALASAVSAKASDVHFHAGGPLQQRLAGRLVVTEQRIDREVVERIVTASLTPAQRVVLRDRGEIDFCLDLPGVGRFRANAYRQQRGLDAVFRIIPEQAPNLERLGLPAELAKYTDYHQGMVLVTGPAGCGKSSTLSALVDHINETREEHILTIEDPIEVVHSSKRCLVNQRHAGQHTQSFARALQGALREDPDVIVIGELRDLATIRLAMTAAETGHFVLATLHTSSAVRTVNRMIGAFPSEEQHHVRAMLSESLKAVVSQRLVETSDGAHRVPALEVLVVTRAIGNLIRDEKTVQIRSLMQTGKLHGMYLLDQSLNELVAAGEITREAALAIAEDAKLITAGV